MSRTRLRIGGRAVRSAAAALAALLLLTGCLYPGDEQATRPAGIKEAVRNVQSAIDQYMEDTRMLPIKNATRDTPLYEKFVIDFAKLKRTGYMSALPAVSYEEGGHYYFLVIDEETDPLVKLMDLRIAQQINDIQSWVDGYMAAHNGEVPKGDQAYPDFYYIDYERMNKKSPTIVSPYSNAPIQAIVHDNGTVFADYGIDIMQTLQRESNGSAEALPDDLRRLLVDRYDFVPVKGPAYRLAGGEPQAVLP
ncbi:hypothetical protein PACILC2_03100 [Paenibacillus cisolokensis]|uniref:DUF3939 domain-containing protein n=1 Tax=Paenibacillus cisolokensis TaxID=1658519 RepID=A0ABQ4N0N0_9BACL|nr:DUF3939 domain-containing protein [Paenibacillus cisolokensis]GIQ61742.1 hypothetical protein PACILC2_03100 [Paenibacillus cisolokensis]